MLEFDWPWAFFFLPIPVLVYIFAPAAKGEDSALRVPFYVRAQAALGQAHGQAKTRSLINTLLILLIWLSLIVSAAKPQWLGEAINIPSSGRDLLVAVDLSGSMETADMVVEGRQIPRFLIVKYVVGEFIDRRESDRLGLILFGTNAYLQAPLTFDRKTVKHLLAESQLGFAGERTAIGDAIGLSIKRLKERPESQRVLILLTDGANTAGEVAPRKAADLAKLAGIKIYTVGVGADEMQVRQGLFGGLNRKINPSAELDEATLQYIADTTGGKYFRARNPQELETIYRVLDKLEPIEQDAEVFRPAVPLFQWPLGIALLLSFALALGLILKKILLDDAYAKQRNATQGATK